MTTDAPDPRQRPTLTIGQELFWQGVPDGHLSISLRVGTVFGLTNDDVMALVHELINGQPEVCQCMLEDARGDLMIVVHVAANDWIDYAHALLRKFFATVAQRPHLWNKRQDQAVTHYNEAQATVVTTSRRIN